MRIVERLRERALKIRGYIASSQRVVDLLAPEMEKFKTRDEPWDTYTVRLSVDHQSSIRTQTKEAEEYEEAADLIERLRGYVRHDQICHTILLPDKGMPCTCGLTALLKEIEGD